MEQILKLKQTIDALFGDDISECMPEDVELVFFAKNKRIKHVYHDKKLLCTLRIDGGLAITILFAQMLLKNEKFQQNCIIVNSEAAPFIKDGKSAFCKHVVWCGNNIQIGSDTPVLYDGMVIAVGKAVLSSEMITDFNRGVAVHIR